MPLKGVMQMESIKDRKIEEIGTPLERKKKKGKFKWIVIGVIIIGLGLGGYLGRNQVAKWIQKIPGSDKVIKVSDEEEKDVAKLDPKYEALQQTIDQLNQEILALKDENNLLQNKVESLTQYETQYNDFLEQKKIWEQEVASTNSIEFIKYYEQISPEQAQVLYQELKQEQVASQEQKKYAKIVGDMDEEQAAKAIEKIVSTDPELVRYLFNGMASDRQSAILSAMTEQSAAQVIKLLAPPTT